MLRPRTIAAIIVAVLAFASSAAAQDCACFNYSNERGEWVLSFLESYEVGPLYSSDGTLLSSREEYEAELANNPPEKPGDALWCASRNDPRCAPSAPSPDDSSRALRTSTSGALNVATLRWPRPASTSTDRETALGGPRSGVRSRVERPPPA